MARWSIRKSTPQTLEWTSDCDLNPGRKCGVGSPSLCHFFTHHLERLAIHSHAFPATPNKLHNECNPHQIWRPCTWTISKTKAVAKAKKLPCSRGIWTSRCLDAASCKVEASLPFNKIMPAPSCLTNWVLKWLAAQVVSPPTSKTPRPATSNDNIGVAVFSQVKTTLSLVTAWYNCHAPALWRKKTTPCSGTSIYDPAPICRASSASHMSRPPPSGHW